MIRVFLDHVLQGEHSEQYNHATASVFYKGALPVATNANDLIIFDPVTSTVIKTYPVGSYHVAGRNIVCGFILPNPNCPNCQPVVIGV